MSLAERKEQMMACVRCSSCKWVTLPRTKSKRFSNGCPSVDYGHFHSYSAGGKNVTGLALLDGMAGYSDEVLRSVHACSMCGSCQVSCSLCNADNVNPIQNLRELRIKLVEDGELDPGHMGVLDGLRREDNTFGLPKAERASWAEGLGLKNALKEKVDVYLHVGCHLSFEKEQWPIIRGAVAILQGAGIDVGFASNEEGCCGCRAYEMGFKGEMENFADSMVGRVKQSGAKTLVTCCSDCYSGFRQIYPLAGKGFDGVEVVHITEMVDRLIREGTVRLTEKVPMRVVYHDPCHLGRLGELHTPWSGVREFKKVPGTYITVPPREVHFGGKGVYEPPRNILKAVPGLDFAEMERIREYSYCCGAGGGAKEAYPDFALKAASERLQEAKAAGADAIVTACPWCEKNFKEAAEETGEKIEVYDLVEIVLRSMGKTV